MNNFRRGGPFVPPVTVDLNAIPLETCLRCGSEIFSERFLLKKLSAVQSPKGVEETVRFQIFICEVCGTVKRLKEKSEEPKDKP